MRPSPATAIMPPAISCGLNCACRARTTSMSRAARPRARMAGPCRARLCAGQGTRRSGRKRGCLGGLDRGGRRPPRADGL
jgi:hypothetical protein